MLCGMSTFGGATAGAIVKVRCPHCGTFQARARKAPHSSYRCRECRRTFSIEVGLAEAAKADELAARRRK